MNNKRYKEIIKKHKIENENLTLKNYLIIEQNLENQHTQKNWLSLMIDEFNDIQKEEIKLLLVNSIIIDDSLKTIENLIDEYKDYLSEIGKKELIEYGYKVIDKERIVDDEISYSGRYIEIGNLYYRDLEDIVYDFKNYEKENIELDEEDDYDSKYKEEIEVLNENSEYFSNLEKEDRNKFLVHIENLKINREDICTYYEELICEENEGFDAYTDWDEDKIRTEVISGFDEDSSNYYIELNLNKDNRFMRISDIAWNDNYNNLLSISNDLEEEVMYKINLKVLGKEPNLLETSAFNENEEFQRELVSINGSALEYVTNKLKEDKVLVLIAVKDNIKNIKYASKEIQELCKNSNAIDALTAMIMKDEFEKDIKNNQKSKKKKI